MKLMTFDVGGTEIKYGLIDENLKISQQGSFATPKESFEEFCLAIEQIWSRYKGQAQGVAMALPGPVDAENGYCEMCSVMSYPHDKDVAGVLGKRLGCNVAIQNDGKAAALAEHRYGAIKGCQNAAVFLIGTGVGGGLIINNQLVSGPHFTAGEFSFLNTQASDYESEDYILGHQASTTYLLERYKELSGNSEAIDGRRFFSLLENDPCAVKALDDLCTNIAIEAANLYILLDLQKIAIGGGISRQPIVTKTIQSRFAEVWKKTFAGRIHFRMEMEIVPCRFSNDANLIGAYITYLQNFPE